MSETFCFMSRLEMVREKKTILCQSLDVVTFVDVCFFSESCLCLTILLIILSEEVYTII